MKNKNRLFLICLVLIVILAGGCAKTEQDKSKGITPSVQEGTKDQPSGSQADGEKIDSNNSEGNQDTNKDVIPYQYTQKLNTINDNYRNVYEIFPYSFYDSNGDGIGDLKGITSKLDYINDGNPNTDSDLGFDAIWLMPIMPSTTYHKYDVINYYNIDPQYGTLDDFKTLLLECHKRGIKVILDYVFNHTSAKHPWFIQAKDYLESLKEGEKPDLKKCPYVAYYHYTNDYNGDKGYHRVGTTEWYYEGAFWDQMPDLNLGNKAVRKEIEKASKFWLDMGVDGFRLDAAKEYYSGEQERNIEVLKWFSEYVKSVKKDAYLVAEVWDEEAAITNYYKSGIQSLFNFPLSQHNGLITSAVRKLGTMTGKSFVNSVISLHDQYQKGNQNFIDAPFISNHDTTRISAQCLNNEDQMKLSAGVLLTMNGSPYVYYGEEIGMNSMGTKDENKRLPMQWSGKEQTGMSLPAPNADKVEQKFGTVEDQMKNPLSIYNYYKRAIRIRNENPEIARGTQTALEELSSKDIGALSKDYQGSKIVILYNFGAETNLVNLTSDLKTLSIRGYLTVDGSEVTLKDGVVTLPKYAIAILK